MDASPRRVSMPPMTLAQVEKICSKWLSDHDLVPLPTALAVYAANMIMQSEEPE